MEDRYCEKCDCELAEYEWKGKVFCGNCLVEHLEESGIIQGYSHMTYYIDGEHLGSDDDMSEVVENLQGVIDIKELDD